MNAGNKKKLYLCNQITNESHFAKQTIMKKLLIFTFLLVSSCMASVTYASVSKLTAYSVAYKYVDDNGEWTQWTDWEDCNILVVLNLDKDRLSIYSNTTQEYDIISYDDWESDGEGGKVAGFDCVDAEGLRCRVRWRIAKDMSHQVYVDYNDFCFVYNVVSKD